MSETPRYHSTLSFLLAQVSRAHTARAHELLAGVDLQPGQVWILDHLWNRDGQSHAELANCLCIQPPTLSKWIDRLEAAGLVTRQRDVLDARIVRVHVTARAIALRAEIDRFWAEIEAATLEGLSDQETCALHALLRRVYHNLDHPNETGCS